ncbi:DNA-methyltransferase [Larkinella humicola]|uniref:Methyltransferase n=1 Tax=Larkinella humicola TaxID=2607654 RepID=A0A5N1JP72_9BACT|nr:site-specific DNA-methyltransferase [Larkinella humicola]KAA9357267.1 site-specific DNA-methyltransferase [Larkinella humicola]
MNRLLCGDALRIVPTFDEASLDAVITDPPYSSGGTFRGDRMQTTTKKYQLTGTSKTYSDFSGDNRDGRSWAFWSTLWMSDCFRVLKTGCPIVVFSDWRMLPLCTDALQAAGFVWRGIAVWDKTEAARPDKGRFRAQAEYLVWGSKGPMAVDRLDGAETRCLPGVFRAIVRQDDKFHLTGKPTNLMRQVVKICAPGGTILDPFMGSGSTGKAAQLEGYPFVGIDLSQHNVDIAQARINGKTLPSSTPTLFTSDPSPTGYEI